MVVSVTAEYVSEEGTIREEAEVVGLRIKHEKVVGDDSLKHRKGYYEVISSRLGEKITYVDQVVTLYTTQHYRVKLCVIPGYLPSDTSNLKPFTDWLDTGLGLINCYAGTVLVDSNNCAITITVPQGLRVYVEREETGNVFELDT